MYHELFLTIFATSTYLAEESTSTCASSPKYITENNPLMAAVMAGNLDIITELLLGDKDGYGQDVGPINADFSNEVGMTPLRAAIENNKEEIAYILINIGANIETLHTDDERPIHLAARHNMPSCVDLLVLKGAKKDEKNIDGCTALSIAAINGAHAVVDVLLKANANIYNKDNQLDTPLHDAVRSGSKTTVDLLLKRLPRSSLNERNISGYSPLDLAATGESEELVRALLNAGADPNDGATPVGETCLHLAVMLGTPRTVLALLEYEADVDAVDNEGNSAMHLAAVFNSNTVAHILTSFYAELDLKNTMGLTALDLAIMRGNAFIVHLLVEMGADISSHDPVLFLEKLWPTCYDIAYSGIFFENFDDFVVKVTSAHLASLYKKTDWNEADRLVETYEDCYIFALYRILKRCYATSLGPNFQINSSMEERKSEMCREILKKITKKTYMETLPVDIVEDAFMDMGYKWELERLPWLWAFASYTLRMGIRETKDLLRETIERDCTQYYREQNEINLL